MKLHFKLIVFIIFLMCNIPIAKNYAHAEKSYYARINQDNVLMFQDSSLSAGLFIIPKTYFVEIFSEDNDCYWARYDDIYGYVKKSEVMVTSSIPVNPFLTNVSFRVFVPSGANLRSTPQNNGALNLVCTIPFLDSNILFIGEMTGEESISNKGTTWYYCKYYLNNNKLIGYVYSPLCDSLTPYGQNTEEVEYLTSAPDFGPDISKTNMELDMSMSGTAQTLIIIAISLPCLLFIYLLFKPTLLAESANYEKKSKTKKQRKKISRLKHSDYFEFDDDDFE